MSAESVWPIGQFTDPAPPWAVRGAGPVRYYRARRHGRERTWKQCEHSLRVRPNPCGRRTRSCGPSKPVSMMVYACATNSGCHRDVKIQRLRRCKKSCHSHIPLGQFWLPTRVPYYFALLAPSSAVADWPAEGADLLGCHIPALFSPAQWRRHEHRCVAMAASWARATRKAGGIASGSRATTRSTVAARQWIECARSGSRIRAHTTA